MYYCIDCENICEGTPVQETTPSEFWGTVEYTTETYLLCENCGSDELEELGFSK